MLMIKDNLINDKGMKIDLKYFDINNHELFQDN